jgi:hypothetical protein
VAWLVQRDWHTEIGLPAAAIAGPLAPLRDATPGAAALLFGFGKRSFMVAPARGLPEWIAGPFPGPGVMQVTALRVRPPAAMAAVLTLPLPPGGTEALERAIHAGFAADAAGRPVPVSVVDGSAFYEASERYSLTRACNAWTARMLEAAGLPVSPAGVVLTGGVLRQAAAVPGACR